VLGLVYGLGIGLGLVLWSGLGSQVRIEFGTKFHMEVPFFWRQAYSNFKTQCETGQRNPLCPKSAGII